MSYADFDLVYRMVYDLMHINREEWYIIYRFGSNIQGGIRSNPYQ